MILGKNFDNSFMLLINSRDNKTDLSNFFSNSSISKKVCWLTMLVIRTSVLLSMFFLILKFIINKILSNDDFFNDIL